MQAQKISAGLAQGAARLGITRDSIKAMAQSASTATAPPSIKPSVAPLFTPFKMGRFELAHRMVYPPLTRNRGTPDNVPSSDLAAEYYSQRATPGGLMITEGTYINDTSSGYPNVPGLWNERQVEAWKPITKAVHDKGAVFFTQIWHVGRAAHPDLIGGRTPVAPSVNKPSGQIWLGGTTMADYVDPHALTKDEIKGIVGDFRTAARNALAAGFDGVEIHGANGYLIDQFLKSSTNQRTDEYGGSIEKRIRFALEIVAAVTEEVGADRVGIRLSPFTDFLDATDETPYATFVALVEQLNKVAPKLAYIHMIEARIQGNTENADATDTLAPFRKVWHGPFIAAGGYKAETGAEAIASGHADLVAYGRLWIANPDLPRRFQLGAPLNRYDRNTFYGQGPQPHGYTDYPFLAN